MKKSDWAYFGLVLALAGALALTAWREAWRPATISAPAGAALSSSGKPRRVDPALIQRLIRQGRLADHPALFSKEAPAAPLPPERQ